VLIAKHSVIHLSQNWINSKQRSIKITMLKHSAGVGSAWGCRTEAKQLLHSSRSKAALPVGL
jgi:hypothetical protein